MYCIGGKKSAHSVNDIWCLVICTNILSHKEDLFKCIAQCDVIAQSPPLFFCRIDIKKLWIYTKLYSKCRNRCFILVVTQYRFVSYLRNMSMYEHNETKVGLNSNLMIPDFPHKIFLVIYSDFRVWSPPWHRIVTNKH